MGTQPVAARAILKDVFGYDTFRAGQAEVIGALMDGRDALALMPTGGGKSLCYQIPSIARDGVGIVISPLIALMTDQVNTLQAAGVRAACIHSGLPPRTVEATLASMVGGQLDLVYVAPERAQMPRFQDHLRRTTVALVAIDEAHCVDKWGHDFRDDYLGLHNLRAATGDAPWFACTATADRRSLEVIQEQLQLKDARVVQGSYDRPNIRYDVLDHPARSIELSEWITATHDGHVGIVYCRSRRRTEQMADQLRATGIKAVPYHAGLAPERRRLVERRFRTDDGLVVCATIAFGMGIDRSDVRFVVHAEPPDSMDAYIQETGRAGRDGLPADARLYIDGRTLAQTARNLDGPDARVKANRFRAFLGYLEATACRRQVLLGFFDEAHPGQCGLCDNCDEAPATWDATEPTRLALEAVHATGQRFGSGHIIDLLLGKTSAKMTQNGHDKLLLHGAGTDWTPEQWTLVFRHLVAGGKLRADRHGGLSIGRGARSMQTVLLRHPRKTRATAPQKARKAPASLAPGDEDLFSALRACRLKLARAQGVPAFVVFSDATLLQMAAAKPRDDAALLGISGIGRVKLERYGADFLAVIAEAS